MAAGFCGPDAMSVFENKNALIFGGANGIGRAVALEFARRGARLAVADIDLAAASETAAAIADGHGSAVAIHCDVTSEQSIRDAVAATERQLGDIDIVVNNVGVILSGNPQDIPVAEWQRILDLNLLSVVRSNDVLLPKMLARGAGHIVNTASFAGLYPYATSRLPYVAAKAAVIALTESLALYLLPKGIRVSCFCPGPVMTGVMKGMKSWSDDAVMCGPGRQFALMTAEQAALVLADGMANERIVIPTDDKVWELIRQHAASPDQFIRDKIDAFERGDFGLPGR